jgi:hypothetical protein
MQIVEDDAHRIIADRMQFHDFHVALAGAVRRSAGEWPCTSALGLRTRRYSAGSSKLWPLSNDTTKVPRSFCRRSSVGQGPAEAPVEELFIKPDSPAAATFYSAA